MLEANKLVTALAVLAVGLSPLAAETIAFRGATLLPIDGPPIERGTLVVRDGKITAVGAEAEISVPAGAREIDATGKVIMPGLVDTHSHVGRVSGGDRSAPLHPEVRSLDAIDVRDPSFVRALAGGVTTANIMPGSGHLMSGQTTYVKIRRQGYQLADWLFCDDPTTGICGGMKMANGTNSMRQPPFPGTRAKSAALARALYVEAQEYQKKIQAATGDEDKEPPPRDLRLEPLVQVLEGERIVHFHTHRHDDIETVLRLSAEFGFDPVIQHGSEAHLLGPQIAARGLFVSLTLVDSPGGKEEILGLVPDAAAKLAADGVQVVLNTDDLILDSRWFLRLPALAVRFGLDRDTALAAVTLTAARALDLDHRVGSLTVGKDADFAVLDGDPLSVYSRVLETWVEGRRVFDFSNAEDRAVAVGGYGALAPRLNPAQEAR